LNNKILAPKITERADEILQKYNILENPYFMALKDGSMSRDAFIHSQEQFYFAVVFFPQPMASLIARIHEPQARINILKNLVEEHGEFQNETFHETTFKEFLNRLGSKKNDPMGADLSPALRAFNSVLITACTFDEIEVGICCMGIIEYLFADISACIGKTVVKRNWFSEDQMIHYTLHEKIDKGHAQDFFTIVENKFDDKERLYYIDQGLQLGAYIFDRLYRDMYQKI